MEVSALVCMRNRKNNGPAPSTAPKKRLTLSHVVFFVCGMTAMALAHVFVRSGDHAVLASAPEGAAPGSTAAASPWGELEYSTIELERPEESFPTEILPVPPTEWVFENGTAQQALETLRACRVPDALLRLLTDPKHGRSVGNAWIIRPPPEAVIELEPAVRARFYAELSRSPRNIFQRHPLRLAAEAFPGWIARSGLTPEHQELFRRLAYPVGEEMLFADYELVEARCTLAERKALAKAASRTTALMVSLRVLPGADLEALNRYWGRGRGATMKPFLEALAHASNSAPVNVSYFLPPFARLRLYTYPAPNDPDEPDCFWTAMNFFNEQPDPRFADPAYIRSTLETQYTQVQTNWCLGDLITLFEGGTNAIHMCVYVADNVVYTKNGVDHLQPWVLMRLPDMLKSYRSNVPIQIRAFRRKDEST